MSSSNSETGNLLVLSNEIIPRLRARDNAAFKELFDKAFAPLVRFAYGFLRSYDDARDVVQGVFVKIMEQGEGFNPQGSLPAYLYKAVRNASLNLLRDTARKEPVSDEILADDSEYAEITFSSIDQYLSTLSERQRTAINLRFIEQRTIAESAEILGISTTAAKNLINRAIKTIQERYRPE